MKNKVREAASGRGFQIGWTVEASTGSRATEWYGPLDHEGVMWFTAFQIRDALILTSQNQRRFTSDGWEGVVAFGYMRKSLFELIEFDEDNIRVRVPVTSEISFVQCAKLLPVPSGVPDDPSKGPAPPASVVGRFGALPEVHRQALTRVDRLFCLT